MPPGRKRSIVRDKVCAISVLSNINTHTLHTRFVEHGVLSENFFNPPPLFFIGWQCQANPHDKRAGLHPEVSPSPRKGIMVRSVCGRCTLRVL